MKQIMIIAAFMLALAGNISADNKCGDNCKGNWKEKMESEKIAFLTTEISLTPEEAQTFWPVYNEIQKEKDKAMHKVFKTFKALNDALEAGKPEKEISVLLDNYLDALDEQRETDSKAAEKYRKALPVEKVAKLYAGEEKFRRQHIRRMKAKPDQKPGHPQGPRPAQRPQPRQ